ncbi:hypothetical protein EDD16DRAFT_1524523 [Pisolithus croceorrhizus]|nr:hypothetical protein EDD16DRAFT_1524523 [Pisolithus croceorrhizus]KAI6113288.1 hypothetical protein EV401DRAFT_1890307 [Pisolithus croceorrhizus]KAI6167711.1 hypothetical protein EDD17DRAFT_1503946 [Pisolithus thermaeus]
MITKLESSISPPDERAIRLMSNIATLKEEVTRTRTEVKNVADEAHREQSWDDLQQHHFHMDALSILYLFIWKSECKDDMTPVSVEADTISYLEDHITDHIKQNLVPIAPTAWGMGGKTIHTSITKNCQQHHKQEKDDDNEQITSVTSPHLDQPAGHFIPQRKASFVWWQGLLEAPVMDSTRVCLSFTSPSDLVLSTPHSEEVLADVSKLLIHSSTWMLQGMPIHGFLLAQGMTEYI